MAESLNDEHTRLEAAECIRGLIETIRLVPENGKLRVDLYGELAALLNLANRHPRSRGTGVQVTLVAGNSKPPIPNAAPLRATIAKIGPNPGPATSVVCTLIMRSFSAVLIGQSGLENRCTGNRTVGSNPNGRMPRGYGHIHSCAIWMEMWSAVALTFSPRG